VSAVDEMTKLRHYCRNPHCRSKLKEPVENQHRAFCTRGCYNSFYLSRCRVCERDLRSRRGNRLYCRPPEKCRSEAYKWPDKYSWLPQYPNPTSDPTCADSTGIKFGLSGHRPRPHCLRHWWWGDPVDGDLSLYDEEGLTIARLVLEDGSYRLRAPVTWPRLAWRDLEQAKHGAESIALANLPLEKSRTARKQETAASRPSARAQPSSQSKKSPGV
jgi:hypothetical protein